jgi:hypothetical protein
MPRNKPSENFREWMPHTTEKTPGFYGRGLADYQKAFGFELKDLEGANILDLGSGPYELFAHELENSGIHAKIISLNPDYSHDESLREDNIPNANVSRRSVAGLGQELPLKNNFFKFIFAVASVSQYSGPSNWPEAAEAWSREALRVLQESGKFYLLQDPGKRNYNDYLNEVEAIKDLLIKVGFKEVLVRSVNSKPRSIFKIIATK